MKEPLYVIDGYGMIYRSYYAFMRTPIRNRDGKNVSAVFGFFRVLAAFIRQYRPRYLAVAMDSRTPTFRDELFADYKATRQATPDELKEQFPVIEAVVAALGLPSLRVDGFEADDLLATVARRCAAEERECFVVSADKDLLQLVGGGIRVLRPANEGGFSEMDRDGVFAYKGVWPEQIVDILSLIGDTSDNIPGVKGVGEKTAIKLLEQFGSLDGIYAGLDAVSSASQRQKLADGRDDALFSRRLVTLRDDVPLDVDAEWSSLRVAGFNAAAAAELLRAHGVNQPANDLLKLGLEGGAAPAAGAAAEDVTAGGAGGAAAAVAPGAASGIASSLAAEPVVPSTPAATWNPIAQPYEIVLDMAGVERWTAKVRAAGTAAIDTETDGLDPHTCRLAGISLAVAAGEACYIPFWGPVDAAGKPWLAGTLAAGGDPRWARSAGKPARIGPILPEKAVRDILKPLLTDPGIRWVGQNCKFDWQMFRAWGVEPCAPWFDTMVAAWLADTTANRYNMDELARARLNYETIHFEDLFDDPGILADDAPAQASGEFDFGPTADAPIPTPVVVVPEAAAEEGDEAGGAEAPAKARKRKLPADLRFSRVPVDRGGVYSAEDSDITWRLWKALEPELEARGSARLFREVEMPLVPLLADLEWRGMVIRPGALEAFSAELALRLDAKEKEIHEIVGHPFNIASTKQLQEVLFVERKLQGTKKTKTGFSTDTSVLEELASEDPVPQLILEHRSLAKLKSTYADALPALVNPRTGRVHTHLVQTGTATGRLSSKDPNLQNLPIRDEDGRRIRAAFVPPPGHVLVSADYSQIELVVLAHYARDPGLTEAFTAGIDVHRSTGALIFGVEPEAVTPEQRRIAKTINFGVMYGMGAYRLGRELGIPQKQAQGFIDAYFAHYSGIKAFIEGVVAEAERSGGVRTLLGRFRPIPQITSRNRTEKQAAERVAVNTPIQGTAADIVKLAMLRVDRRLKAEGLAARMVLQVHDELILEVPESERERVMGLLREEMPLAAELAVPLRVSVEAGMSWGEMH